MHELLLWMAQGTAVIAVLMFVLWLLHFPLRNAAIADIGRAIGIVLLAMIYAIHGVGYWRRVVILLPMVVLWGLRLAFYLLFTRLNGQQEDSKSLLYFEAQALLCGILSLPFLLAMHDPAKGQPEIENAGACLWVVAFLGETIADAQLSRFRKINQSRVCNTGLWRYSQHPNYFFEWLIWMSYALVASTAQNGYLAFLSPALMLFVLLRRAPRSKSEAYRKYQQSTSPFIPWFPNYK